MAPKTDHDELHDGAALKSAMPPIELKASDLRGASPIAPEELLRLSRDGEVLRQPAEPVLTALRKVKDLPYTTIATGHGPMLRLNLEELVQRWGCLSQIVL